jgi:homoserine dehydrogenase
VTDRGGEKTLRIGIAGLGTVGGGLLKLLQGPDPVGGGRIEVVAVSARNRSRKRDVDISAYKWVDDPGEIAADPSVDVFVELIGGSDGPAKHAVEIALKRGASVVTANKALVAEHGAELAKLTEEHGGALLFEAAVGGGVPVVKAIRESFAGARIQAVSGILNGTCNYILTEMEALLERGRQAPADAFAAVLAEAQRAGYAEADPTMDVSGVDSAHKIAILAGIAFGFAPDFKSVSVSGVTEVTLLDIRLAGKLGYRIKLLAKAEREGDAVRCHVHPALLAFDHPLAAIGGALNAVVIDAEPMGRLMFSGRGAGAGPTAAAVAADLLDLLNGARRPMFGRPLAALRPLSAAKPAERGRYYLRLLVKDRPGVIAAVADRLAKAGVSIESFLQDAQHDTPEVPIVLTTQICPREALDAAVAEIASLDVSAAAPFLIPIEDGGARRPWSPPT